MSFEDIFDAIVFGSTEATEDQPEVQKVFELENALPDLLFVEQLGDFKAQGAAGFADQLIQDHTPEQPSSLPRTISMEMETLKSEEPQNLPVEHHPQLEIQSEANHVKFQCTEEMQILEPEFAASQYAFKHAGKTPFYEIKGKKVVQLKVSAEPLDHQWIFT